MNIVERVVSRWKRARTFDGIPERVASRYVKAFGIPMGKTVNLDSVRIHRYSDVFKVWDLTNAGKRGKKVETLSLSPSFKYKGDRAQWMENMSKALAECGSFMDVHRLLADLDKDYPGEIDVSKGSERGVDVNPGGTTKLTLKTNTGIEITADPLEFILKTHVPLTHHTTGEPIGHQDTLYWPENRAGATVFYNWLKANLATANKMDIQAFRQLWSELNIKYTYH